MMLVPVGTETLWPLPEMALADGTFSYRFTQPRARLSKDENFSSACQMR
jgi:hypothetical protein